MRKTARLLSGNVDCVLVPCADWIGNIVTLCLMLGVMLTRAGRSVKHIHPEDPYFSCARPNNAGRRLCYVNNMTAINVSRCRIS